MLRRFALLGLFALGCQSASAASINVLWYTYADVTSSYRTVGIPGIAAHAGEWPEGGGLDWNLTFYDNSSPTPDFNAYDVLVTESGEPFRTGPASNPGLLATPNYAGILNNKNAISAARGDRTAIVGTDADFHAIRTDSGGQCTAANPGVCGQWNGALGFLINLVDWAASGDGLGIVALLDGEVLPHWWKDTQSFLHDDLLNTNVVYQRDNHPLIAGEALDYPLNDGLSSDGLSNWINSFHAGFVGGAAGYSGTVFSTVVTSPADKMPAGTPLVLVTSAFAAAPVSNVPLPTPWLLFGSAVVALATVKRRGPRAATLPGRPGRRRADVEVSV